MISKIKTIFLDMDGVLVNYPVSSAQLLGLNYEEMMAKGPKGQWPFFTPDVIGISEEEFWRRLDAEGQPYWALLPPYPWFKELFEFCERVAPTYILTQPSPTNQPDSLSGKLIWLRAYFGPSFRKYVITVDKHLLANPGTLLVDDLDENVERFKKEGGQGIVFPQPWNSQWEFSQTAFLHVMAVLGSLPTQ